MLELCGKFKRATKINFNNFFPLNLLTTINV